MNNPLAENDPLTEIVSLLQPGTHYSKLVSGGGYWRVQRPRINEPFYCVVLEGSSRLEVDGHSPIDLSVGDFILIPNEFGFVMSSHHPKDESIDPYQITILDDITRHGDPSAEANVQLMVGHFVFGAANTSLLVSLLPRVIHIRGEQRLQILVQLLRDESRGNHPAQQFVLTRLLEVMLIEALRCTASLENSPGLLRALSDARLSIAIRRIHEAPERSWTVAILAKEAALSRSAFFDRFRRIMGIAPMEYVLSWRMALAKDFLCRKDRDLSEIAERVGYRSASAFSVAFARFAGVTPGQYTRTMTAIS